MQANDSLKKIWQKLRIWLRVEMPADGLEVSDHAVRWCRIREGIPQTSMVKLSPGVVQDGRILDRAAFVGALWELRAAAFGKKSRTIGNLIVTLSIDSAPTFMRLFELPSVDRQRLGSAVALNLQMVAPGAASETASGWHIIHEDRDSGKVLIGALFIDRSLIDTMVAAAREAGFVVVAAESKALSLARAVARGQAGVDPVGNYVAVYCDDTGVAFAIVRAGVLGFAYEIPWSQVADPQGAVSEDAFRGAVAQGTRQIMNFYRQRWSDVPVAILVAAGDLFTAVQEVIAAETPQPAVPLAFGVNGAMVDVPIAFGAALRGTASGAGDQEITFLGADAMGIYDQEKTISFFRFWAFIMPVVLAVVLLVFAGGDFAWLRRSEATAAANAPSVSPQIKAQLANLTVAADDFNRSVASIRSVESLLHPKSPMLTDFEAIATAQGVGLGQISIPIGNAPIIFSGVAGSEEAVIAFKNALSSSTYVSSVTLPLSGIQPTNGGFTFSMTASPK